MGLGQNHKHKFKMMSTYTTKKKNDKCKLNGSGVVDLVRTTSSTNFTQSTTFGKRHHSSPYNIIYACPQGLHPNVTFPQDSQMGVPKLGPLLSQNFGCSYLFQIKFVLKMQRQHLIFLKKNPIMYSTPQLELIWPLFSKGLWLKVKFSIWLLPFLFIITHANQV